MHWRKIMEIHVKRRLKKRHLTKGPLEAKIDKLKYLGVKAQDVVMHIPSKRDVRVIRESIHGVERP